MTQISKSILPDTVSLELDENQETQSIEKNAPIPQNDLLKLRTQVSLSSVKKEYELLASNEVTLTEKMTPERIFSLANFSDEKIAGFQVLTEPQKQNILKYFAEGYNPNLTTKQIKKLANNLYYFYSYKNQKLKRIKNPNLKDIKNGVSMESTGKSIEEVLTTHGTQFSDEGRKIDKLRDEMLEIEIQRLQQHTQRLQELGVLLDKLLNN